MEGEAEEEVRHELVAEGSGSGVGVSMRWVEGSGRRGVSVRDGPVSKGIVQLVVSDMGGS